MLAAANRLRKAEGFRNVTRFGVKAGRSTLVIYMSLTNRAESRAGFVVSKAVGNAVARNRVKRRLRHLVKAKFIDLATVNAVNDEKFSLDTVVRANPAAANETEFDLASDFHQAWQICLTKVMSRYSKSKSYENSDSLINTNLDISKTKSVSLPEGRCDSE